MFWNKLCLNPHSEIINPQLNNMKYHLVILGCQMNYSDAERIRTVLEKMGFQSTDDEQEANLIGIVACSVRQKAIDKVYTRIYKWNKMKAKRQLVTFVSGCILDADETKFAKLFDLLFRMEQLPQLPDLLRQSGVPTSVSAPILTDDELENERTDFWHVEPTYSSQIEAFIPIQNGCNKFCTYCAVPYTRGREVSRPSGEIIDELKALVERGNKVITLLGQNVNSYGLDKKGEEISFAQLLEQIGEYGNTSGKEFWVYFTSPHPHDMTDDVIEMVAKYPVLGKQIHLPLQSGDDEVLKKMNRRYTVDDYMKIVKIIREKLPTATLFTDIIVGFNGETEEQFQNTVQAVKDARYNMIFAAMYSPRPGAKSATWEDDVPHKEKSRRHQELNKALTAISLEENEKMVGKTIRVIVESEDSRMDGALRGKSEGRLIVRILNAPEALIGEFVNVTITEAAQMSMTGVLANG